MYIVAEILPKHKMFPLNLYTLMFKFKKKLLLDYFGQIKQETMNLREKIQSVIAKYSLTTSSGINEFLIVCISPNSPCFLPLFALFPSHYDIPRQTHSCQYTCLSQVCTVIWSACCVSFHVGIFVHVFIWLLCPFCLFSAAWA